MRVDHSCYNGRRVLVCTVHAVVSFADRFDASSRNFVITVKTVHIYHLSSSNLPRRIRLSIRSRYCFGFSQRRTLPIRSTLHFQIIPHIAKKASVIPYSTGIIPATITMPRKTFIVVIIKSIVIAYCCSNIINPVQKKVPLHQFSFMFGNLTLNNFKEARAIVTIGRMTTSPILDKNKITIGVSVNLIRPIKVVNFVCHGPTFLTLLSLRESIHITPSSSSQTQKTD